MVFVKADPADAAKRLVLSLWGDAKEGKTHFSLTAPPPIWYINLDFGVDELLHKFPGLDVRRADLEMTEATDASTYKKLLANFHKDYVEALTMGGTVVVDTATQLWQVVQKVKLDAVIEERTEAFYAKHKKMPEPGEIKLFPFDYADANTYMGGLLRRAAQQRKTNVIFINRAKEDWSSQGPTGTVSFQGFKDTAAIVQMTLKLFTKREGQGDKKTFKVMGKIESCRFDKELEGMELENPDFETLLAAVM